MQLATGVRCPEGDWQFDRNDAPTALVRLVGARWPLAWRDGEGLVQVKATDALDPVEVALAAHICNQHPTAVPELGAWENYCP